MDPRSLNEQLAIQPLRIPTPIGLFTRIQRAPKRTSTIQVSTAIYLANRAETDSKFDAKCEGWGAVGLLGHALRVQCRLTSGMGDKGQNQN